MKFGKSLSGSVLSFRGKVPGLGTSSKSEAGDGAGDADPRHPSALVIVGPSGVGKGTLVGKLKAGNKHYGYSVSHTTREPRVGEKDGTHYHFVSRANFQIGVRSGKFLEYATVHKHQYGTSKKAVQKVAKNGQCCILELDVQGARQVRKSGIRAIFVFVAPPSLHELERRLRSRGTESSQQIELRLEAARDEMQAAEEPGLFDAVIVNDDLDTALAELREIGERALAGEVGPLEGLACAKRRRADGAEGGDDDDDDDGDGGGRAYDGGAAANGGGAAANGGAAAGSPVPALELPGRGRDGDFAGAGSARSARSRGADAPGGASTGTYGSKEFNALAAGASLGSGTVEVDDYALPRAQSSARSPSGARGAGGAGRAAAAAANGDLLGRGLGPDHESDGTDGSGSAAASAKSADGRALSVGLGAASASASAGAGGGSSRGSRRRRLVQLLGCDTVLGGVLAVQLAVRGQCVIAIGRDREGLVRLQRAAVSAGVPINDFLPVLCDLGREVEVAALPRIVERRWPGRVADVVLAVADEPSPAPSAWGAVGATPLASGAVTPAGERSGMATPAGSAYGGYAGSIYGGASVAMSVGGPYGGAGGAGGGAHGPGGAAGAAGGPGAGALAGPRQVRFLDGDAVAWLRAMHGTVLGQALAVRETVASLAARNAPGSVLWVVHRDDARDHGIARAAKTAIVEMAGAQRREAEARGLPISISLLTLSRRGRGAAGYGAGRGYEETQAAAAGRESVTDAVKAVISALDHVLHHPEVSSLAMDLPAAA